MMSSRVRRTWEELRVAFPSEDIASSIFAALRTWISGSARGVSTIVAEFVDTSDTVRRFMNAIDSEIAASHRACAVIRRDLQREPPIDPKKLVEFIGNWVSGLSIFVLADDGCGGHGDLWVWSVHGVPMLECDVLGCAWTIDGRRFGSVDRAGLAPATRSEVEALWPGCDLIPVA